MEVDEVLSLLGLYGRWQMLIYFSVNILGTFASAFSTFAYLFQDKVVSLLGCYGLWQILIYFAVNITGRFQSAFSTYAYIFQAYTPAHHCKVLEGEDISLRVPWINSTQSFSSCLVFINSSLNNATIKCSDEINDWDYYGDVTDTIVSEWNLVCGRQYLKKTTSTVNLLGYLVGTSLSTPFMDYFGRRPVFLICLMLNLFLGIWNVFVYNYYVYLVVRFLSGFVRSGYSISSFILACELFPANQRTFAGIILSNFWGAAVCILALLMYLFSNWRHLQMFIALTGLLVIPMYWLLPESVPWLITKGRVEEAERIVQAAARMNKITNFPTSVFKPYSITKEVEEEDEEEEEKEEEDGMIMGEEKIVTKEDRKIKEGFGKGLGGGVAVGVGVGFGVKREEDDKNDKNGNRENNNLYKPTLYEEKPDGDAPKMGESMKQENLAKDLSGECPEGKQQRMGVYQPISGENGCMGRGEYQPITEENGANGSGHANLSWCSKLCQKGSTTGTQYSLIDVIRHRRLRTMTLVMCFIWYVNMTLVMLFIWFVNVIVYYGITLNTEEMTGNRHVNLFLSGLVEIPAYTLSFFVIKKWGRRIPLVWLHIVAGVSLILSQIIPKQTDRGDILAALLLYSSDGGVSLAAIEITLSTIGKFSITASFGIIWLYTAELFPTSVRSQAAGVANICGRVGGMIAPFSTSLNAITPWLMSVVFGIISLIGGLLTLLLPETNNRALPQTIDDIECWYTSKKSKHATTTTTTTIKPTIPTTIQSTAMDHRGSITTI